MVERLVDYSWSSYRAYGGGKNNWAWLRRDFLLGQVGQGKRKAQKNYRRYVEEAVGEPDFDPLKKVVASTLLGSERFIEWVREKWIKIEGLKRDIPALKQLASGPDLELISKRCQEVFGQEPWTWRKAGLYLSHRLSGLRLEEIGRYFGGISSSAVSQNTRRFRLLLEGNPKLSEEIDRLIRNLSK